MKVTIYGKLDLLFLDGHNWLVQNIDNRFYAVVNMLTIIKIPDGFITDFASIPRTFWNILPPCGDGPHAQYGPPAIFHDYLYKTHMADGKEVSRKFADDVLFAGMEFEKVETWKKWTIYCAVRTFGGIPWNKKK